MDSVKLDPYIFFNGNAKEAMEFYKTVFGGELLVVTFGESSAEMPNKEAMKDMIMHASLESGSLRIMASDSEKASATTSKIELSLSGPDETKLKEYFDKLSAGGNVKMPLKKESWGDVFGMLTDKFGVDWMINISAKKEA